MEMIGFLILFPLVVSGLLMVIRQNTIRNVIVCASGAVIAIASIVLVGMYLGTTGQYFYFQSSIVDYACLGISIVIGVTVLAFGFKYRNGRSFSPVFSSSVFSYSNSGSPTVPFVPVRSTSTHSL